MRIYRLVAGLDASDAGGQVAGAGISAQYLRLLDRASELTRLVRVVGACRVRLHSKRTSRVRMQSRGRVAVIHGPLPGSVAVYGL